MMNIDLNDLDREQAIVILKKIVEEQPSVDHLIQEVLNQLDFQLNHTSIAQEVFITLDLIDIEDLWHNSGPTRHKAMESWLCGIVNFCFFQRRHP